MLVNALYPQEILFYMVYMTFHAYCYILFCYDFECIECVRKIKLEELKNISVNELFYL